MTTPTLSVGLPVYNGERYLAAALESILDQTYEDFELIISDNASTDRTEHVCRRYASEDPRIRYVRLPENIGASRNYNHTVELARGRFFRWAAHDDLCAPTNFERCMDEYRFSSAQVVLVYPRTLLIDENGNVTDTYHDGLDLRDPHVGDRIKTLINNLDLCNAVFGIVPTDVLRRTGLLGSFVGSDEVLLAELCLLGQFREIPETLFHRRLHSQRSLEAFPDPRARILWFDPSASTSRSLPRTRILVADLHSLTTLPIPMGTRIRALPALVTPYLARWWKSMARELVTELARGPFGLLKRRLHRNQREF